MVTLVSLVTHARIHQQMRAHARAADGAVESKSEATADGPPDAKQTKRTVMESDSDSDDD